MDSFTGSQYTVDNSALVPDWSYDRVGYYVELESAAFGSQYVWVSADTFNPDASFIGVPDTAAHIQQMQIDDMNVVSNVAGVTEGTGLMGNIEFWNTNYTGDQMVTLPGGTNNYDFDDTRAATGSYGSMQIHNFVAGETLFAYNHWNDVNVSDLGIGNQPAGNPDWTFAATQQPVGADDYTVKNLYVLVRPVPEPAALALLGLGGLATLCRRRRKR